MRISMDKREYNRAIRREVRRRVKEQVTLRTTEADPQVSLNNAIAKVSDTTRSAMSGDVSAIKRHWVTAKMNYANIPMTYAKRLPDKQFRSIDAEIRRMKPGEDVSGLIGRLNRLKVALGRVNLLESIRLSEFGVKVGGEETVDSVAKFLRSLGWNGVVIRQFAAIANDRKLGVGIVVTVDVGKSGKVLKIGIGPIEGRLPYPKKYTKNLNAATTPGGAVRRLGIK